MWQALTTADGLSVWFGERASIDLRPGGAATMTFAGGMTVDMRVERVEEPTVFAYTWRLPDLAEDDPRRTYVDFTLEPDGDGTRLARGRVVARLILAEHDIGPSEVG